MSTAIDTQQSFVSCDFTQVAIQSITVEQVSQVYSGRQGCMCGCRGNYSEQPAQKKRVLKLLQSDPRSKIEDGILHREGLEEGERNYVIYLQSAAA